MTYSCRVVLDMICMECENYEDTRISNNLNQYAKKANETGKLYEEDIAEIKKMNNEQTELLKRHLKQLFIYMRTIQRRESELIKSVSVARRFIRSSRGLGAQDVRWTSALRGPEWNGDLPNKQKWKALWRNNGRNKRIDYYRCYSE